MKVTILGAGAFGTALGEILENNHFEVVYYDPRISEKSIAELTVGADYLLLAVPSAVVTEVVDVLPKDIPLIVATKGILTDKIFREFSDYMVLSGPGFADDIKAHKKTYLTSTDKRINELFRADYIEFDFTDDEKGVLMCGALKNVYAIYAGLLGLERDSAEWLVFIAAASAEMKTVLEANGAMGETVDLFCGTSDLILTCGYPSRNFEFGDRLRGDSAYRPEKTVEGISALRRIRRGGIKVPKEAEFLRKLIKISEGWDF